jgi:hypothetical protein
MWTQVFQMRPKYGDIIIDASGLHIAPAGRSAGQCNSPFGRSCMLLLGEPGEIAVGVIGLMLLASIATGVYLWWPKYGSFKKGAYHQVRRRQTKADL